MDRSNPPARPRASLVAVLVAVLGVVAACTSDGSDAAPASTAPSPSSSSSTAPAAPDAPPAIVPGDAWAAVDAAEAGFDPGALDALAAEAEAAGSTCLVVTRDGQLVHSSSWGRDTTAPREAFSVTKSVTSFLVGIAADDGDLDLEDPAATYLPSWAGTPSADVTVTNLLSNDSGREWSTRSDYVTLVREADQTAYGVSLGQDAAPGTTWAYNNAAIQTLSGVLLAATGEPVDEYAREHLLEPIGMADSAMSTDRSGGTLTFMGLRTTCEDLARFGLLALRGGAWDGEQVVPADFVARATGRSSTSLNAAYGLLWWLNRKGPVAGPLLATTGRDDGVRPDSQLVPGAPDDAFWALGFNNQVVAVLPEEGIVAVRMGARPPADRPFSNIELTTGVLDAMVDG